MGDLFDGVAKKLVVAGQSRLSSREILSQCKTHLSAHRLVAGLGQCERRMDPTIGVHDLVGHIVARYAIDGVAKVLLGGNKCGTAEQKQGGHSVVQLEDVVVYEYLSDLDCSLESGENVHVACVSVSHLL